MTIYYHVVYISNKAEEEVSEVGVSETKWI